MRDWRMTCGLQAGKLSGMRHHYLVFISIPQIGPPIAVFKTVSNKDLFHHIPEYSKPISIHQAVKKERAAIGSRRRLEEAKYATLSNSGLLTYFSMHLMCIIRASLDLPLEPTWCYHAGQIRLSENPKLAHASPPIESAIASSQFIMMLWMAHRPL